MFQAADVVFFPGVGRGVVLRHVTLVGGDVEAVFALGGAPDAVPVHVGEDGAKLCGVCDARCHVDEGTEYKVAVGV